MVVLHVLALQQELQSATSVEKGLFSAEIGLLSMAPAARADQRLHSIVNSSVADNPLAPGADEETAIQAYCLAKMNLTAVNRCLHKITNFLYGEFIAPILFTG